MCCVTRGPAVTENEFEASPPCKGPSAGKSALPVINAIARVSENRNRQDSGTCPASGGAAFRFRRWKKSRVWPGDTSDNMVSFGSGYGSQVWESYNLLLYHELRWTYVSLHNDSVTIKVCVHKVGQRCASAEFT
jgi:hypothetical protein